MLILFDHGTPRGLIRALSEHTVMTAQSKGWDRLSNGALLNAAEEAGIDLALVVLTDATKWSRVRLHMDRMSAAVAAARPGTYAEVEIYFN